MAYTENIDFNTGSTDNFEFTDTTLEAVKAKERVRIRQSEDFKDIYPDEYAAEEEEKRKERISNALAEPGQYLIKGGSSEDQAKQRKDNFDYGTDGDLVANAKALWNTLTPYGLNIAINKDGKEYSGSNKYFNDMSADEARDLVLNEPEDPNGSKILYYLRVPDGVDSNGTPHYTYKLGTANVSAYARYKDQVSKVGDGARILMEKRVKNADNIEHSFHGAKGVLEQRAFDLGMQQKVRRENNEDENQFGAGYTELYNTDILGLKDTSEDQIRANEAKSAYDYIQDSKTRTGLVVSAENAALNIGSAGINGVGKFLEAVGTPEDIENERAFKFIKKANPDLPDEEIKKLAKDRNTNKFLQKIGRNMQKWDKDNRGPKGNIAKFLGYKPKNTGSFASITDDIANGHIGTMFAHLGEINYGELIGEQGTNSAAYMTLPTLAIVMTGNAGKALDELKKNNNGKEASKWKKAEVVLGSIASDITEKLALKGIFGNEADRVTRSMMNKMFPTMPKTLKGRVFRAASIGTIASTGKASGEAAQNVLQEGISAATTKYGTENYTGEQAWEDFKANAGEAAVSGFVTGKILAAPHTAFQTIKGYSKEKKVAIFQTFKSDAEKKYGKESVANGSIYYMQNSKEYEDMIKNGNLSVVNMEKKVEQKAKKDGLNKKETGVVLDMFRFDHTGTKMSKAYKDMDSNEKYQYDKNRNNVDRELDKYKEERRNSYIKQGIDPASATERAKKDVEKAKLVLNDYAIDNHVSDIYTETELSNKAGSIIRDHNFIKKVNDNADEYKNVEKQDEPLTESKNGIPVQNVSPIVDQLKKHNIQNEEIVSSIMQRIEPTISNAADKLGLTGDKRRKFIEQKRSDHINNINIALKQSGLGPLNKLREVFTDSEIEFEDVAGPSIDLDEVDKATKTDAKEKKNNKTKEYDYLSDEVLGDILDGGSVENINNSSKKKIYFNKIRSKDFNYALKVLNDIFKKTKSFISGQNDKVYSLVKDEKGNVDKSKVSRLSAISMSVVSSASKSESDIMKDKGLIVDEQYGARAENVYHVIGKKFLESYGVSLKGGEDSTYNDYAKIGKMGIDILVENGSVKVETGTVAKDSYVENKNTSRPARKNYSVGSGKGDVKGHKTEVISLIEEDPNNLKDRDKFFRTNESFTNKIYNMLLPNNQEVPLSEPSEEVADTVTGEDAIKAVKTLQKSPVSIKEDFIKILDDLSERVKDVDFFDIRKLPEPLKQFLSIGNPNDYPESERASVVGKNNKRLQDLSNILDWYKTLSKDSDGKMYFTYDQAINDRIHTIQTMFEAQGDKYLARQILGSSESVDIDIDSDSFKLLIGTIAEELGIEDPNDIINGSKDVDELVDAYSTESKSGKFGITQDSITSLSKILRFKNNPIVNKLSGKVPLLLSALSEIKNIREQISNGVKSIKSNYLVGTDAISSGVTNSLLNIIGRDRETISRIFRSVGIFKSGNLSEEEMVDDLYGYLNSAAKEVNPDLDNIFKELEKKGVDTRDMAKYPLMAFFYGQEYGSMRKDLVEYVYENMLEHSMKNKDSKTLNKEEISKWVDDNIGSAYESALGQAFKPILDHKKDLESLYTSMMEITKLNSPILIRSPLSVINDRSDSFLDLRKKKEVDIGTYSTHVRKIASKLMPHIISPFVNPQHAIDAAILLQTVNDVSDKYKDEFGSVLTVHDAFYANPNISMKIIEEYNKNIIKVAKKYDIYSELINSLQSTLDKNKELPDKERARIQESINEHKKKADKFKEIKNEVFNDELSDGINGFAGASIDFEINFKSNTLDNSEPTTESTEATEAASNYNTEDKESTEPDDSTNKIEEAFDKTINNLSNKYGSSRVFTSVSDFVDHIKNSSLDNSVKSQLIDHIKNNDKKGNHFYTIGPYSFIDKEKLLSMENDPRFTTKDIPVSPESVEMIINHEMLHTMIDDYIDSNPDDKDVKEVNKFIGEVKQKLSDMGIDGSTVEERLEQIKNMSVDNKDVLERMSYAISNPKEIVNIMTSEVDISNRIGKIMFPDAETSWSDKLYEAFIDIINSIYKVFSKEIVFDKNNTGDQKRMDTIKKSMIDLLHKSKLHSRSIDNVDDRFMNIAKNSGATQSGINISKDPFFLNASNSYIKNFFSGIFNKKVRNNISNGIKFIDKLGDEKSNVYSRAKKLINHEVLNSDLYNKLKASIGLTDDADKVQLAKMLSESYAPEQEAQRVLENDMVRLDKMIIKNYTKKNQDKIYDLFASSGFGNLARDEEIYARFLKNENIEDIIETEIEKMSSDKLVKDHLRETINGLAEYNLNGVNRVKKTSVGTMLKESHQDKAQALIALKVISMVPDGDKFIKNMIDNKSDIYNEIVIGALANAQTVRTVNRKDYGAEKDYHDYDGSGLKEIYEKDWTYEEVTEKDLRNPKYTEKNGYKFVVEPNDSKHIKGIVAKEYDGLGFKTGVGLHTGRLSNGFIVKDIKVPKGMSKNEYLIRNNMVEMESPSGSSVYKYVFTTDQKVNILGMHKDTAKALWTATAQNSLLNDLTAVRNMINDKIVVDVKVSDGSLQNIADKIAYNKKTNGTKRIIPYFLHISDMKAFHDLPKEIQSKYTTPDHMTNYNNQKDKITLVRSDYKDILMGHTRKYITSDESKKLRQIEKVYRKLVVMMKIHMAVLGPKKLAADIASNTSILVSLGVPPTEIISRSSEALRLNKNMIKLRNELVELKMKLYAHPDSKILKRKIEAKTDEIKRDKFYPALKHGFIQSVGTDLIMKEFDSIGGLQKDVDNLVGATTRNDDGSLNLVGKAVMGFANFGIGVEDVLKAATVMSGAKKTDIGKEILEISDNIKKIKTEKDIEAYISNIIATPRSEMVKAGSGILLLSDITARWTAFNYFMSQGNSEEEAAQLAHNYFIDYRVNVPKEIDAIASLAITLFPNFWMKAQRSIYLLLRDHPASSIAPFVAENYLAELGFPVNNGVNIINANIFNRIDSGILVNEPSLNSMMFQPYF